MMKLRKSRVAMAVGAVLGAAALAPTTSFGWSVDTQRGVLGTNSGGDTLLFPLYTTGVGATTSFSTTNTSDRTIVAKIRFREQERSMDVLDFMVVYSPKDKFDFYVQQAEGSSRPQMVWSDSTCVIGPDGSPVNFPAPSAWVDSDEAMAVGHLEVLGMADITRVCIRPNGSVYQGDFQGFCNEPNTVSLAAAAKHADGVPANCGLLRSWLGSPGRVSTLNNATPSVLFDVPDVLVGRYLVTVPGKGIEAGNDAIAIQDSNLTCARVTLSDPEGDPIDDPLIPPSCLDPLSGNPVRITAQSDADCSASNNCPGNSLYRYHWDSREWDHPHLGWMQNLFGFQFALAADNVAGDWSNNPGNDVGVDWLLSFPNKYAYLDYIPERECDSDSLSTSRVWCLLPQTRTTLGAPGIWTQETTTNLCLRNADPIAYDTEEEESGTSLSVSPGATTQLDLCEELEIFTLAISGQEVRDSVIQTPDRRRTITFENLDALRGWAQIGLPWTGDDGFRGDAVTGLIFTVRNTDDPTINNASLTDLQKDID
jgi:hypothetical protein